MRRAVVLLSVLVLSAGCMAQGITMNSLNITRGIGGLLAQEAVAVLDSVLTVIGTLIAGQIGLAV